MILLVKLILAHLLGDFLLQPYKWVKAKEEKKLAAWQLYLHILIHLVLIMFLAFDAAFLKWAIIIAAAHLIIDAGKVYLMTENTKRLYFFLDQSAHFLVIVFIWFIYEGNTFHIQDINYTYILLLITAIYILTTPISIAIKYFISKWTPHDGKKVDEESLAEAGKYIGILERLFVFGFIITNHWEAIGFLLAAKSIFRFGDLKEAKDLKLTEYVLIGTLVSFGVAMLVGYVYNWLLPWL